MKIIVTARVFDALNHAGLLKSGATSWEVHGKDLGNGLVECELAEGESVAIG